MKRIKDSLRSQNYRILNSANSSYEDKLIAVFDLISDKESVHSIQQLMKISEKPLNAF